MCATVFSPLQKQSFTHHPPCSHSFGFLLLQPHRHGEIQVEPNPACIADTQVPTAAAGSGAEFIVSQNTVKQNVVKIQ